MKPKFKIGDKVIYMGSVYTVRGSSVLGINQGFVCEITDGINPKIVNEQRLEKINIKKQRGFGKLSSITQEISLPVRATSKSAGYDISVIHPLVYRNLSTGKSLQELFDELKPRERIAFGDMRGVIKLPTGIKAYMLDDEVLNIHVRSSLGIKQGYTLANGTGIIDSDYYNNEDNEGHIIVALKGVFFEFTEPVMRVAQGIFQKYLTADDDNATKNRNGGIGSTNGN